MLLENVKPSPVDTRDYVAKFTGNAPDFVDLMPDVVELEDQAQFGSCTANAGCSALELMYNRGIKSKQDFSRMFLYFYTRQAGNIQGDNGAWPRDLCATLKNKGTCSEVTWPYVRANIDDEPSDAAQQEALSYRISRYESVPIDVQQIKLAVAQGIPVLTTIAVSNSFMSLSAINDWRDTEAVKKAWNPKDTCTGYHEVLIIGYDSTKEMFLVQNSWGPSFSDGGFFGIPFDYLPDVVTELWAVTEIPNVPLVPVNDQKSPLLLKKTTKMIKIGLVVLAIAAIAAYRFFNPII